MRNRLLYLKILILTAACSGQPKDYNSGEDVSIFPDYTDITVPSNIAPANFMIQDEADRYFTLLESGDISIGIKGKKVAIPIRKWRQLTANGGITVTVFEQKQNNWLKMKPFKIDVADEIDPYLSYRVIPPVHESYMRLTINQRNLTNFKEKVIYANTMAAKGSDNQCINCHSFKNWHTDNMQFHIRQYLGGTILYRDGKLQKLNTGTLHMIT